MQALLLSDRADSQADLSIACCAMIRQRGCCAMIVLVMTQSGSFSHMNKDIV